MIMDVMMRTGLDGLSAAEMIKEKHPEIKIIMVTSTTEASWESKAREIGAEGFWYKEYSPEPLESIIRRVTAGEICYPENVPEVTFGRTTKAELTDREHDVLRELIGDYTNEEIAQRLGITVNTVRYHIQNLLNKTGFESRLSLAVNAKVPGIVVNENDRQHFLNK